MLCGNLNGKEIQEKRDILIHMQVADSLSVQQKLTQCSKATMLFFSCSVLSDSFATPGIIAHHTPLSMGFCRQEYWSGLPFSPPGDLPDPGIEPMASAWPADSLPLSHLDPKKQWSDQSLSRVRLCDPMNPSTPGLPVHHQLPEFTQTHVHRVSDAIQPSHPLSSPSPLAPNPSSN